jgi:hypothetical protein
MHIAIKDLLEVNQEIVHTAINLVNSDNEAAMVSYNQVHRTTQEDGVQVRLMDHIRRGMSDTGLELYNDLREFHHYRHDIHVVGGVLCYRDRIVIATVLRAQLLTGIHAEHQGVEGMTVGINMTVFWPGIHPDILGTSGSYMTCVREEPSQPAGFPVAPPGSKYPFQMIVADYFSIHGHNFLVIADRFTGWNAIISSTPGKFDGQNLVTILRDFCVTCNISEHLINDGGPQLTSGVFQQWLKN